VVFANASLLSSHVVYDSWGVDYNFFFLGGGGLGALLV
jgi:hypothetical protein